MSRKRTLTFEHKDKRGRRSARAPDINLSAICKGAHLNKSTLSRILSGERGAGKKVLFSLAKMRRSTVEDAERWLEELVRAHRNGGSAV